MYKVPKGTKDIVGDEYKLIQEIIEIIKCEFSESGGEPLDTPIFERNDVLIGKYGEEADNKLLYKLADEGGELLTLRYDLTIPFTRYIKENGIKQMRRYSIGKVYRRDNPNIKSGRYREFIQADFDIYGEKQEEMIAEVTLLNTVVRILKHFGVEFTILINDIRNLKYLLNEKMNILEWRSLCPVIDKLDKQTFHSLKSEFTNFGLTEQEQIKLNELITLNEPMLEETQKDYKKLINLADIFGFSKNLVFTNSLARGLDYYTGFIWEFKINGVSSSVSAGGRYDNLLGKSTVGISVGISRLALYIKPKINNWNEKYYLTTVGNISLFDKMRVVKKVQDITNKSVVYSLTIDDKKLNKVISECCNSYNRYVVIVAENELKDNKFIIKDLKNKTQSLIEL